MLRKNHRRCVDNLQNRDDDAHVGIDFIRAILTGAIVVWLFVFKLPHEEERRGNGHACSEHLKFHEFQHEVRAIKPKERLAHLPFHFSLSSVHFVLI